MAVKIKTKFSSAEQDDKKLDYLAGQARIALGLPNSVDLKVGFSRTTIEHEGVTVTVPLGIPQIKNGTTIAAKKARETITKLFAVNLPSFDPHASVPIPAQPVSYDDMQDEEWVEHVAGKLFPGTIHLYQATEMYQPVLGTSGGSIYKTCFIGPELKIAARIKGSKISFRVTTDKNLKPEGHLLKVIQRLGVVSEYEDRVTVHTSVNGAYNEAHAHEFRALFGAFYAALKPWITSDFPAIGKLTEGVK